jgi:hypothetical protein
MSSVIKLSVLVVLLTMSAAPLALAQDAVVESAGEAPARRSPHHVGGLLGLAVTSDLNADPDEETIPGGTGLMLEARYSWEPRQVWGVSWFGLGGAVGMHRVTTDEEDCDIRNCEVSTRIGYLSGRARVTAPIPWIAPFLETGLGLSFGQLVTQTRWSDENIRGVRAHVPIAFGLELGPRHSVELGFYTLVHPGRAQLNMAAAFGLSFPLPSR